MPRRRKPQYQQPVLPDRPRECHWREQLRRRPRVQRLWQRLWDAQRRHRQASRQVAELERQPDQLGTVGHQHQLHAVTDGEAGDHRTVAIRIAGRFADIGEALAPALPNNSN